MCQYLVREAAEHHRNHSATSMRRRCDEVTTVLLSGCNDRGVRAFGVRKEGLRGGTGTGGSGAPVGEHCGCTLFRMRDAGVLRLIDLT